MLLRYDVLKKALSAAPKNSTFIIPDPKGRPFDFTKAKSLSKQDHIYFISPAYEGVDARIFLMLLKLPHIQWVTLLFPMEIQLL